MNVKIILNCSKKYNEKNNFFLSINWRGGIEKNLFLMANKLSENYNINVLSANKEKGKCLLKSKILFYKKYWFK